MVIDKIDYRLYLVTDRTILTGRDLFLGSDKIAEAAGQMLDKWRA